MAIRYRIVPAHATASPKGEAGSQDRARTFRGATSAGVVVCDGVGFYADSGEVAELAVERACAHLAEEGARSGVPSCAEHARGALVDGVRGATTMLVVGVEQDGHVSHSLVGNGSLMEAEPAHVGAVATRLRWVDLVLPQVSLTEGRPALRSVLQPGLDGPVQAALGTRTVDAVGPRLYLACTDGIATGEERVSGTAPDGSVWMPVPAQLARILGGLEARWSELVDSSEPDALLAASLQATLDELLADDMLDDDATIGAVLVLPTEADTLDP